MNDDPRPKRWFGSFSGLSTPKNAIVVGIIIGGILGSTLALAILRVIRPPAEQYEPEVVVPVRVIPPRTPAPAAMPSASSVPRTDTDAARPSSKSR